MIKNRQYIDVEWGYYWLNKLFSTCSNGYIYVFFICNFITYFFLYKVLQRKKVLFMGLFFFFCLFFGYFNSSIRQAVAMSIFLYSIKFIEEKKLFKYLLLIFLGFLFHSSILFFIPLYFVDRFNLSKGTWIILFAFCFLVIYSNLYPYILDNYFTRIPIFGRYIGTDYAQNRTNSNLGVLCKIILGLIVILYKEILIEKDRKNLIYVNLFLIGTIITIFSIEADIISRIAHYLLFVGLIMLPTLLSVLRKNKISLSVLIILIALAFWEKELWFDVYNIIPYQTIFNIKP